MLQDQAQVGNRARLAGDGLLLRASLDGETATVQPVYRVERAYIPQETSGAYQVELFNHDGESLGVFPAELYEAEEMGVAARMLVAYAPGVTGDQTIASVQFLKDGRLLAERAIEDIQEYK